MFIGSAVLMCFLVYGLIYTLLHKKLDTQDVAAWVQAVGSIAAIYAVFIVLAAQQSDRDKQARNEMKQVILSLADEVRTLTAITRNSMGQKLLDTKSGGFFQYTVAISENPFPIFSSCALFVPKIEDDYVRRKIIETYTTMQSVVSSFKMNNFLISEFVKASEISRRTQFELDIQRTKNCMDAAIDYLPKLQKLYAQAIKHADELDQLVKNMDF